MAVYPLICVVDTSIIIDLYRGEILAEFFKLPYVFVTADVILEELLEPEGKLFMEFVLRIDGLESSYVLEVFQIRTIHRKPSVNDLFAFILAKPSMRRFLLMTEVFVRLHNNMRYLYMGFSGY